MAKVKGGFDIDRSSIVREAFSATTYYSGDTLLESIVELRKSNFITVAKSGGDFVDIREAIHHANTAVTQISSVFIYPGEYDVSLPIDVNNGVPGCLNVI